MVMYARSLRLLARARAVNYSSSSSEQQHFAALADSWWDANGPQRILHKMNLMRMDFIRDVLTNSSGPGYSKDLLPSHMAEKYTQTPKDLKFLDVGCGGGLLSESLARADFCKSVVGIDITPEVIAAAKLHQKQDPSLTNLKYENTTIENLSRSKKFDVLTMFEVVEHLDDPTATLKVALEHVNPGGWAFLSTINRTALAYLTTIFAGEQLLRIVPPGTHTWSKYINEFELREFFNGLPDWQFVTSEGCLYVPTVGWTRGSHPLNKLVGKSGGNYLLAARKMK